MSLINVYLTLSDIGWGEYGSLDSENEHGRCEAMLALGGHANGTAINLIVDQLVQRTGGSYVASLLGIEPAGSAQEPYKSFGTFDTVSALQPDNEVGEVEVRGISATADRQAHPIWTIEAQGLALEESQEVQTWLRRAQTGFLGGQTETATPARPVSKVESGDVQAKRWEVSKDASATSLKSHDERLKTPGHICLWEVTLSSPNADEEWSDFGGYDEDISVRLRVSATTVAEVTVPAGDQDAHVGVDAFYVSMNDIVWAYQFEGPSNAALVATARWI